MFFEITTTRISDDNEGEKKHIIYSLQIRHTSGKDDSCPSVIERRYTDFLNFYMALKAEHPTLLASITFPKKVLLGNFENKLISERSTGFQALLKHVTQNSKLRGSVALLNFLQNVELYRVKSILAEKQFSEALPLLENNFRLLNKVYTDRSPAVLLALCRLLGCCVAIPGLPNAQKWADLALHRYDGVSDSDLLELYVPLLQTCIIVWCQIGRDKEGLERRLTSLRKQGLRVNEDLSLLDAVEKLEQKLFSTS